MWFTHEGVFLSSFVWTSLSGSWLYLFWFSVWIMYIPYSLSLCPISTWIDVWSSLCVARCLVSLCLSPSFFASESWYEWMDEYVCVCVWNLPKRERERTLFNTLFELRLLAVHFLLCFLFNSIPFTIFSWIIFLSTVLIWVWVYSSSCTLFSPRTRVLRFSHFGVSYNLWVCSWLAC